MTLKSIVCDRLFHILYGFLIAHLLMISRDPKKQVAAREKNETFRGFKIDPDTSVYDTTPGSEMGVPREISRICG